MSTNNRTNAAYGHGSTMGGAGTSQGPNLESRMLQAKNAKKEMERDLKLLANR